MTDPRVVRMAEVLVDHSAKVKEGEAVLVWGYSELTKPLIVEVCREVIRRAATPVPVVEFPEVQRALLEEASAEVLRGHKDPWLPLVDHIAATVMIETATPLMGGAEFDPRRVAGLGVARRTLAGALHRTRLAVTLYPTAEAARAAGMGLEAFEDYVFGAVDHDWGRFGADQQRLIDSVFAGASEVNIKAEDTDITLSVAGRTFLSCEGSRNLPGGEILTSPVESAVNGHIAFTYPAIFPPTGGRRVEGVRLWFEGGKAVEATARDGQEHLDAMLNLDEGARYVGELAFGTNPRMDHWTGSILLDEKMGGTMHLALGRAYPEAGGVNESNMHWDFITDLKRGSEVRVDGLLVQQDGKWVF
jgi:aminopeptidase